MSVPGATIRLDSKDRDDLRFNLRQHRRRVEELYDGRSFYELSSDELNVARKIIQRESQQPIAPTFRPLSGTASSVGPSSNLSGATKPAGNGILSKLYAQDKKIPTATNAAAEAATKAVPSGSVPASFSMTAPKVAPRPTSRLHETSGIRLVGNSLVDHHQLMINAQKDLDNFNQKKQRQDVVGQKRKLDQKEALLAEVDALINRKSSHDAEAAEEWHQQYQNKLKKLEKREFIQEKLDTIQFIEVQAFQCRQCEFHVYPAYPTTCREMGHSVSEVTAIKRFFECAHCGARDSTLTNKANDHKHIPVPPTWRCRCGQYRWVVKGSTKKLEHMASLTGDRLVTSASESTSRKESLEMAVRVSQLSESR
jgi:hypothetical protein